MTSNPLDGFTVDPEDIQFIGEDLQRPECILAERDGTLWSADARGGVVRIAPDGSQQLIVSAEQAGFSDAAGEEARFTEGTLPNGLAFAENGDLLIANFGTNCLEGSVNLTDLGVYLGHARGSKPLIVCFGTGSFRPKFETSCVKLTLP